MLTPDRWQLVEQLFHEALARPRAERDAFIQSSCGDDEELKSEVSSLLAAEVEGDTVDQSIAARAAVNWAASGSEGPALIGREIEGYTVVSLLGVGGMGEVYLAEERVLGRQVALKLLPLAFSSDANRLHRFTEEARSASALNHPNIITVYHVGEFDGRRFIAMEHVDGVTLRAALAKGPLPRDRAVTIAEQTALALAAAHQAGIVHRDIKPENVMLRHDGYVKVLDFGLAKLLPNAGGARRTETREGAVVGTLDYMAPEQAAGQSVDPRADLYSLSVVLYEMLTGSLPRELGSGSGVPGSGVGAISPALWKMLRRGLASDPEKRQASAREWIAELQEARARTPRTRRRSIAVAAAATILIALSIGVARPSWLAAVPGLGRIVPAAAPRPVTSLAIVPFQTLSPAGDEQSALVSGMADALITRLAGIQQLRVPPTAAIRAGEDPFVAGRRLEVDAVLTGTVQREGERLRVTAQVSRVSDHGQVWAGRFDGSVTDIFALQDDFAEQIAANLLLDLSAGERASLRRRETGSAEAYELSLRGRAQFARRTPESIRTAISMYEQAIRVDASYAPAYAGLAESYAVTASGLPVATRFPLAKSNAEKAMELDPSLAAAHSAMAFVFYKFEWRWRDSIAAFQRAIALDPRYPLARHWYGEMLSLIGRQDESAAQLQQALALDPNSVGVRIDYILTLLRMNRIEEARQAVTDGLTMDEHPRLTIAMGDVLIADGRIEEGVEMQFRGQLLQGTPAADVDAQRRAFQEGGLAGMNRRNIQLLSEQIAKGVATTPGQMGLATRIASLYGNALDAENTIRYLTVAIEGREDAALHLRLPQYDFLRDDSRFEALVRRVGMP